MPRSSSRASAPKRLVIDSDVVQAAGGAEAQTETARLCRQFLQAVLEICHQVVLTATLGAEWKRHSSSFARKRRVRMDARKKVLRPQPDDEVGVVVQKVLSQVEDSNAQEALRKDVHLIEAALVTDRIVIFRDETTRSVLRGVVSHVAELRKLVWVNPIRADEGAIDWLRDGAPADAHRQLGYVPRPEG